MCSIVEDDFGDEGGAHAMKEESPIPSGSQLTTEELCRKCLETPAVLKLNLKEPQCRGCFLHYVRHKFRAALGATKIVRRGSRVLVVFTGTAENVVLLDMIRFGVEQEAFKKLRIVPLVAFVSEDCVGFRGEELEDCVKRKLDVLKQFAFPAYFTVIGGKDCVEIEESGLVERFSEDQERFSKVLNGIKSITSKQDLIVQIRRETYKRIAEKLDCPYIFLSEIGVDLAKTLLSNVALGRGRSLSLDIAFCDDRDEKHKIIRPLRDLNPNEIENYLNFAENQLTYVPSNEAFKDKSSLQNLTSKFVDGLQQTFPSTVSTVFKTGDKMSSEKVDSSRTDDQDDLLNLFDKSLNLTNVPREPVHCKLCHSLLDYKDSTTLFATEFSRMVSTRINAELSHEAIVESSRLMEEDAKRSVNGELADDLTGLKKELCHSCRNIFVDFSEE